MRMSDWSSDVCSSDLLAVAAPSFPPLSGRVVDAANLLSPANEQALSAKLEELEKSTGRQLVVATIPDLQGYAIEDYGYQLGRTWAIGQKDKNDGALLIVEIGRASCRERVCQYV